MTIRIEHNGNGNGDWVRVLENEKLIFEGHRIEPHDLIYLLNVLTKRKIEVKIDLTNEEIE